MNKQLKDIGTKSLVYLIWKKSKIMYGISLQIFYIKLNYWNILTIYILTESSELSAILD
jgi:hypothetical protein